MNCHVSQENYINWPMGAEILFFLAVLFCYNIAFVIWSSLNSLLRHAACGSRNAAFFNSIRFADEIKILFEYKALTDVRSSLSLCSSVMEILSAFPFLPLM